MTNWIALAVVLVALAVVVSIGRADVVSNVVPVLEIPVDSEVADMLKKRPNTKLPKNKTQNKAAEKRNMRKTTDMAMLLNDVSSLTIQTVKSKGRAPNSAGMKARGFSFPLPVAKVNSTLCPYASWLKNATSCNPNYKYRSHDGSCNNLLNPLYGRSNTPYKRMLPPAYADTLNAPRTLTTQKKALPNARIVSLTMSPPQPLQRLEDRITQFFTIFGQFLTHDISGTSAITDADGNEKLCPCGSSDPDCALSVNWPKSDPYLNQSCMSVTRSSATFPSTDCKLGMFFRLFASISQIFSKQSFSHQE